MSIAYDIRIHYHADITESIVLWPFFGYNQIGGSGESDNYTFDTIEIGSFFLWNISKLSIGIGGKYNFHLNAQFEHSSANVHDRSEWITSLSDCQCDVQNNVLLF